MFKFYELITKISSISKPTKRSSRGFNIGYSEPEGNKDFLLLVSKQNFS